MDYVWNITLFYMVYNFISNEFPIHKYRKYLQL